MSLSAYLLANKRVEAYSNFRFSALKIEYALMINPFMHDPGLHASTHTQTIAYSTRMITTLCLFTSNL